MNIFDDFQYSGNPPGMNRVITLVATIAAALIVATVLFLLYNQQRTIDDLASRNTELRDQVHSLDQELRSMKNTPTPIGHQPTNTTYTSEKGVSMVVTKPAERARVASPLTIEGKVPGSWSFEAQFSVQLRDSSGAVIAQSPASLQGDWMTDQLVPFTATLNFTSPRSKEGTLRLEKANPSDLPANSDSVSIPVTFE